MVSIFFMAFAHVSPGIVEADLRGQGVRGLDVVYFLFGSLVAKSAVPLLSVVSGWLLAETLARRAYTELLSGKVFTLLVPMVFWNIALLALVAVYIAATNEHGLLPQSALGWVNAVFSLTAPPANIQLAFLRDLFVCAAFAPAMMWAARRAPWTLMAGLACLAVLLPPNPVILRPEIAFFFTLGLLIPLGRFNLTWVDRAAPHVALGFMVFGSILLYLQMQGLAGAWQAPQWLHNALVLGVRLNAALFFWWLAGWLLRTPLQVGLLTAGRFVFIVFCSHVILFKGLGLFGRSVVGGYYGDWYPAYFLAMPFLAFAAGWAIDAACRRYAPNLLRLMLGRASA